MEVMIVNESVPYPANSGNRVRTLNLMLRMAKRHHITYICRADADREQTEQAREFLAEHDIAMIVADAAPPGKRGLGFAARLVANCFSRLPYAVASHHSLALRHVIRKIALHKKVDLWQFEWLAYANALRGIPGVKRLVMAHNVESLIWQRYAENQTSLIRKLYLRQQWRKFKAYEKRVFQSVDGVVCVSRQDATLAAEQFGAQRTWVVDNGIDKAHFQQTPNTQRQPHTVLFLGSLEWRPNIEAVRLLLDQVFPQVCQIEPKARLCIVGRMAPPWLVQRVAGASNIELHSSVPDVRPYLASATVMAVPLRVGGGSRLKILEAMACGLPVVSTTVGYEGLELTAGREIVIADDAKDMASQLVQIMRDPMRAAQLASGAKCLANERYDWDVLAERLETIWQQTVLEPLGATAGHGLAPFVPVGG